METVKLLGELGHDVVEDSPLVDKEEFALSYLSVVSAEASAQTRSIIAQAGEKTSILDFEPSTQALAALGSTIDSGEYTQALNTLSVQARKLSRFFENYDILLTPTLASPPVPIGSLHVSDAESRMIRLQSRLHAGWVLKAFHVIEVLAGSTFNFIPYTAIFNVTGQPAMSVPLCQSADGLPVGMQFAARFGDEATLFRLAAQLERVRPWFNKLPPGLPY
jgi:amidase